MEIWGYSTPQETFLGSLEALRFQYKIVNTTVDHHTLQVTVSGQQSVDFRTCLYVHCT